MPNEDVVRPIEQEGKVLSQPESRRGEQELHCGHGAMWEGGGISLGVPMIPEMTGGLCLYEDWLVIHKDGGSPRSRVSKLTPYEGSSVIHDDWLQSRIQS